MYESIFKPAASCTDAIQGLQQISKSAANLLHLIAWSKLAAAALLLVSIPVPSVNAEGAFSVRDGHK